MNIYIYICIYIYATFYKTTPDVSIMQNDWVSHLGAYRFTMRQLPNIKNTPYYRHLREIAAAMPAPKFTFSWRLRFAFRFAMCRFFGLARIYVLGLVWACGAPNFPHCNLTVYLQHPNSRLLVFGCSWVWVRVVWGVFWSWSLFKARLNWMFSKNCFF
jgi:hypothetical protein